MMTKSWSHEESVRLIDDLCEHGATNFEGVAARLSGMHPEGAVRWHLQV